MNKLQQKLKFAMNEKGIRAVDLADATGISKGSISQYLSGYAKPGSERVYLIAKALGVTQEWLMGFDDQSVTERSFDRPNVTKDYTTYPVMGNIAAGFDKIALEDWTGERVDIPNSYLRGRQKDDFFVLCVKGDSMYPMYIENDKVLILKQSSMDYSGQIGAVIYEDCATLKKVEYKTGEDWLKLIAVNPTHPPLKIEDSELEKCLVLGVPKLLIREIDE